MPGAGRRSTLGAVDEVEVVRVASGPFGVQQLRMPRPDADGVRTLRLMPVGRVVGRIQAGDPRAVRGLAVRVRTDPDPSADVAGVGGFASVVTDDQGRFTIPAIAAGTLAVSVEYRWDLPWRGLPASRPQVQPGTTTEVTIPLKRAGLVKGVVQEVTERPAGRRRGGEPSSWTPMTPLARSDAEGRFSAYVAPGMVFAVSRRACPAAITTARTTSTSQRCPRGRRSSRWSRSGWAGASSCEGASSTRRESPCRRRSVSGHYGLPGGAFGGASARSPTAEGRFRITGLPPDTTVHLSAARGEATTAAPESIPSSKGTITLTIGPENAVALFGRVKDPAGRPLAGAAVRVSARKRGSRDIPIERFTVSFDDEGRTILRTGADGQFRTPRQLRPDLEYHVEVEADGYAPAGTEWIKPGDRKLWYLPALVLQPTATTRTVAGRVVDAQGRPIAGAAVFQSGDGPAPTRATTGADGRFRLPGVYREPAFLFVEGDGLAFEGHRIGTGDEAVELKVRRSRRAGRRPAAAHPAAGPAARGGEGPGPPADRDRPEPPDR